MPSPKSDDLINVRPDERFDEARLREYLRGKLPGADASLRVRQFGGGKANLTYLLRFGNQREFVLRRPPLGPYAPSAHDMGREFRVLSVLHRAFPLAPRALHYCDDEAVIGAPFFLMERCSGVVVRGTLPARFAADASAPRHMSEALVDALVAFHDVDYAALGLSDLGRPVGFIQRQVDGWHRRWQAAKSEDDPVCATSIAGSARNSPRARIIPSFTMTTSWTIPCSHMTTPREWWLYWIGTCAR